VVRGNNRSGGGGRSRAHPSASARRPQPMNDSSVPLCVDLDGTLTPVDTLHESLLRLARQAPIAILALPFWLRTGKARMKREVAVRTTFDSALLPLNSELLAWLKTESESGRR